MNTQKTKLQVPIAVALKEKGEIKAKEVGFGSLNQAVRLFISQLAQGNVTISFSTTVSDEVIGSVEEKRLRELELKAENERECDTILKIDSGNDLIDQIRSTK